MGMKFWPWQQTSNCVVCNQKDEFIKTLMADRERCTSCQNLRNQIKYLEGQVDKQRQEWADERSEYKRAVDRLLEKLGSMPVGQGTSSTIHEGQMDIDRMMGMFNEVEEPKATGK